MHPSSEQIVPSAKKHGIILILRFGSSVTGRLSERSDLDVAVPLFLKRITDTCHLRYGSPGALQRLKIYACKCYQDHRKYLELEREYVKRSLAGFEVP